MVVTCDAFLLCPDAPTLPEGPPPLSGKESQGLTCLQGVLDVTGPGQPQAVISAGDRNTHRHWVTPHPTGHGM